ncbi:MAG TPA: hypothetical protein VFA10_16950 [Ktedonobacteraceae bacterium]|nr:hypothetical protein [Ktedonobacteraceae bacterium]
MDDDWTEDEETEEEEEVKELGEDEEWEYVWSEEEVEAIRAESEMRGEVKGLQTAVVIAVNMRFPALTKLAEEKAQLLRKPGALRVFLRQMVGVPDERMAAEFLSWITLPIE